MLSPTSPLSSRNLLYLFRFSFNPPHMLPNLRLIPVTGRLIELLPVQPIGPVPLPHLTLGLTPGAVADSEPNLDIEDGNIVGAGHASSVGRFDDEELFYLCSRGIPEREARKLVVRGFFGELVEEIGIEQITGHLMQAIDRRLARGESSAMQTVLEEK